MLELKEYIQVNQDTVTNIMPFFATIILKKRERMLHIPLHFWESSFKLQVDSGANVSVIADSDKQKQNNYRRRKLQMSRPSSTPFVQLNK